MIIKYKNTQSTMNRKIYKRNKIKMNERVLLSSGDRIFDTGKRRAAADTQTNDCSCIW